MNMMTAHDHISTDFVYDGLLKISGAMYRRVPHCAFTFLLQLISSLAESPKSTILTEVRSSSSVNKMFSSL